MYSHPQSQCKHCHEQAQSICILKRTPDVFCSSAYESKFLCGVRLGAVMFIVLSKARGLDGKHTDAEGRRQRPAAPPWFDFFLVT
jgi:hypothetical protein